MDGNDEFFENFERNKYLKKLPSMQRVNNLWLSGAPYSLEINFYRALRSYYCGNWPNSIYSVVNTTGKQPVHHENLTACQKF